MGQDIGRHTHMGQNIAIIIIILPVSHLHVQQEQMLAGSHRALLDFYQIMSARDLIKHYYYYYYYYY